MDHHRGYVDALGQVSTIISAGVLESMFQSELCSCRETRSMSPVMMYLAEKRPL